MSFNQNPKNWCGKLATGNARKSRETPSLNAGRLVSLAFQKVALARAKPEYFDFFFGLFLPIMITLGAKPFTLLSQTVPIGGVREWPMLLTEISSCPLPKTTAQNTKPY
jgi:hypothetical protein